MERIRARYTTDLTRKVAETVIDCLDNDPRSRYLATSLLKKFADPDPSLLRVRRKATLDKWLTTERRNGRTNQRLLFASDEVLASIPYDLFIQETRRFICKMIGHRPPLAELLGDFSNGASTSLRKRDASRATKYCGKLDVTQRAWDTIMPWLLTRHDGWHAYNPKVLTPRIVRGNVQFTVPKDAEFERMACKEPDLNLFAQKAAGNYIRTRLKRFGIDLNDQSRNATLAREGSITDRLATIDLSSASDSITYQLVMELLPFEWWDFLDSVRCHETKLIDGTWHENEMFSSMGNGFTFELESMIFFAITRTTMRLLNIRGAISVFGDDIICPSAGFAPLKHIMNFLGFVVNVDKTYVRGPFRESCGSHWLSGRCVKPIFIRRPIIMWIDLIKFLNKFRAWSANSTPWCDPDHFKAWVELSRLVPAKFHGGLNSVDDTSLHSVSGKGKRLLPFTPPRDASRRELRGMVVSWLRTAHDRGEVPTWHLGIGMRRDVAPQFARHFVEVLEKSGTLTRETPLFRIGKSTRRMSLSFGACIPAFPQEYTHRQP